MENIIKISVIVPIYNVAAVLQNTIESILSQTLKEIEIICVDDFSQDNSREILMMYAQKDSRIKLIFNEKNLGTLQARKKGVLAAGGKYIMFVDGDDILMRNACEVAFGAIEKSKTDLLQFGTEVVNCGFMDDKKVQNRIKAMKPCLEKIEDESLINAWLCEKKILVYVWNKIYRREICKKAFELLEDGYCVDCEDWYIMFAITYLSRTYIGIEDKIYQYNYGIGVTGGELITLKQYDRRLTEKYAADAILRLAYQLNEEQLISIAGEIKKVFLRRCTNIWKNMLLPEFRAEGFQHLTDMWGIQNVICILAEMGWNNWEDIAEKILDTNYFNVSEREEDTKLVIAMYMPKDCGDVQSTVLLCNVWAEMRDNTGNLLYKIVFVTDQLEDKIVDYGLDEDIVTEFLPNYKTIAKDNYKARYDGWNDIIRKYGVDIVVADLTGVKCSFWDMLTVKGHELKPAFVLRLNEFCCTAYSAKGYTSQENINLYRMCDSVVTQSEYDREFVSAFSHHAKVIQNPIFAFVKKRDNSVYEENTLLWIGKITSVSRLADIVYVIAYIRKEISDVTIYISDKGDKKALENLKKMLAEFGYAEYVRFLDIDSDMEDIYTKVSACFSTMEYTACDLQICEALAHGLPVVSYDMPWSPLFRKRFITKCL